MLALTEAFTEGGAIESLKKNVNSVFQAASEKLESIEGLLKAWPSRGMVLIEN